MNKNLSNLRKEIKRRSLNDPVGRNLVTISGALKLNLSYVSLPEKKIETLENTARVLSNLGIPYKKMIYIEKSHFVGSIKF